MLAGWHNNGQHWRKDWKEKRGWMRYFSPLFKLRLWMLLLPLPLSPLAQLPVHCGIEISPIFETPTPSACKHTHGFRVSTSRHKQSQQTNTSVSFCKVPQTYTHTHTHRHSALMPSPLWWIILAVKMKCFIWTRLFWSESPSSVVLCLCVCFYFEYCHWASTDSRYLPYIKQYYQRGS